MRYLIILFLFCGCYQEPDKSLIHYYINTENPVIINYKTLEGDKTTYSNNLDIYFEITEYDTPEYFYYKLEVTSEEKQPIYILIEFNEIAKTDILFFTNYFIEDAIYCPSWYNKCVNVTIGL